MQNKAQLEISLETARALMKAYLEVEDCPWEKRFHIDRQEFRECADGYVCEWLGQQDPAQLRDVLTFSVGYLEGQMRQADHQTDDCPLRHLCLGAGDPPPAADRIAGRRF